MPMIEGKIVEWFGGPKDGERFVVAATTEYVMVEVLNMPSETPEDLSALVPVARVMMPVEGNKVIWKGP